MCQLSLRLRNHCLRYLCNFLGGGLKARRYTFVYDFTDEDTRMEKGVYYWGGLTENFALVSYRTGEQKGREI